MTEQMSTLEFLKYLQSRDVTLSLSGDRLRCNAPKGALTVEMQSELLRRKPEILHLLKDIAERESIQLPPIEKVARVQHMPVSFGQQRLWFLHQFEPDSPAYNLLMDMTARAPISEEKLRLSIAEIVRRHEVLRTTFTNIDGRSVQVIAPEVMVPFRTVDLRQLAEADMLVAARRIEREEMLTPFDLARGPLLRVTLVRITEALDCVFIAQHHIITDAWSLAILRNELGKLYNAFLENRPSPLSEPQFQYADYAHWQQKWMQGTFLEKQLAYWRKQLAEPLPSLELPTDRMRPAVQTFRGASQGITVSNELAERIKSRGHEENCTLFMVLVAVFKTLLFRYTGQEDILVGTPNGNRTRIELEDMLGFFVNTQVLRTDLSGNPTFCKLMARVRTVTMGAYAHQEVPFEKLVEELQPKRSLSHSPIFQVMFILQNTPWEGLIRVDSEVQGEKPKVGPANAQFDLTLYAIEIGDALEFRFTYNIDLFDDETITRMGEHLRCLLEGVAGDPSQRIGEMNLLPTLERQKLLTEWNQTASAYPEELCLHHLFEQQVERTPDAVALVFEDSEMSYRELNLRANAVAAQLLVHGVGPDMPVGLCVERSLEMVVGVLGILKAGGAYVPLDPAFPRDRLEFMVRDAKAPVLLTLSSLVSILPPHQARVICLDQPLPEISSPVPTPQLSPNSLAYILYTSGSTGTPKGVQISHRAVVNFLSSMRRVPGLVAGDSLLAITTLSFDIAGLEIYLPLIVGAKVVVASREVATDGQRLARFLNSCGATVMQATPATWRLLVEAGWEGNSRLKMLCGGEALPSELAKRLLELGGTLWNLYGPTETTIWSTLQKIEESDSVIRIGRPIANTEIYILDKLQQPTPIGVAGELCIGGDGLARGYFNRLELTADRFIPNPFKKGTASRLYRTGDLARYRPDGSIECLGRLDFQVKIRGYRIELGEIETVLSSQSGIRQSAVVAREDTSGDKRLVAYIVADQPSPSVADLRRLLSEKLPDYMVPSAYVFLEAFPLTPNGKVDRRALPAPDQARPELEAVYEAPRSEAESLIAQIWQDVLGVERVGIHDNFFDLGGHSLLLLKVHSKIIQAFSRDVPLMEMFRHTTIASFAGFVSQTRSQDLSLEKIQARTQKQNERLQRRRQFSATLKEQQTASTKTG